MQLQEQNEAYSATDWSFIQLLIGVLLASVTAIWTLFRFHDLPRQQIWRDNGDEKGGRKE